MRYRLMASYLGASYQAAVGPSDRDVTLFAAPPPPEEHGFSPAPGGIWRKQVRLDDLGALWESRPIGSYHGEPCLVLDDLGDRLHIVYLGMDERRAAQLGYWEVDHGVFEVVVPRLDVSDLAEERHEFPIALLLSALPRALGAGDPGAGGPGSLGAGQNGAVAANGAAGVNGTTAGPGRAIGAIGPGGAAGAVPAAAGAAMGRPGTGATPGWNGPAGASPPAYGQLPFGAPAQLPPSMTQQPPAAGGQQPVSGGYPAMGAQNSMGQSAAPGAPGLPNGLSVPGAPQFPGGQQGPGGQQFPAIGQGPGLQQPAPGPAPLPFQAPQFPPQQFPVRAQLPAAQQPAGQQSPGMQPPAAPQQQYAPAPPPLAAPPPAGGPQAAGAQQVAAAQQAAPQQTGPQAAPQALSGQAPPAPAQQPQTPQPPPAPAPTAVAAWHGSPAPDGNWYYLPGPDPQQGGAPWGGYAVNGMTPNGYPRQDQGTGPTPSLNGLPSGQQYAQPALSAPPNGYAQPPSPAVQQLQLAPQQAPPPAVTAQPVLPAPLITAPLAAPPAPQPATQLPSAPEPTAAQAPQATTQPLAAPPATAAPPASPSQEAGSTGPLTTLPPAQPADQPPSHSGQAGGGALSKLTGAVRGRRAARKPRLSMSAIFADLVDMADIPRAGYAVDEEITGAMCLFKTDGGYEVFSCAEDARHEVRFFEEEEAAYFYLFGVLAAEALRNGRLTPRRG